MKVFDSQLATISPMGLVFLYECLMSLFVVRAQLRHLHSCASIKRVKLSAIRLKSPRSISYWNLCSIHLSM